MSNLGSNTKSDIYQGMKKDFMLPKRYNSNLGKKKGAISRSLNREKFLVEKGSFTDRTHTSRELIEFHYDKDKSRDRSKFLKKNKFRIVERGEMTQNYFEKLKKNFVKEELKDRKERKTSRLKGFKFRRKIQGDLRMKYKRDHEKFEILYEPKNAKVQGKSFNDYYLQNQPNKEPVTISNLKKRLSKLIPIAQVDPVKPKSKEEIKQIRESRKSLTFSEKERSILSTHSTEKNEFADSRGFKKAAPWLEKYGDPKSSKVSIWYFRPKPSTKTKYIFLF
jgi:hypothetical protein